MTTLLLAGGLAALIVGAQLLVRGASRLAAAAGISPLVIGLTVVAFGTSAPEMAVSAGAALAGRGDIALGNVVGSNIFNVLCILGVSALITPLVVSRRLVRLDVPIMIGVSGLLLVFGLDGALSRLDGALLLAGIVAYTLFAIRESRRDRAAPGARERGGATAGAIASQVAFVLAGLALLVLGAGWLVDGAVGLATRLGVSDLVVGLTIVAAGTSLPEVATSVVAAVRGERDIAVGNVVGSNIANVLAIAGLASVVAPAGIPVSPAALGFDIPVMAAAAVACLPIFFSDHCIARWEGGLFLAYYAAYVTYLFLAAVAHDALPVFNTTMLAYVLPLTAVTLLVLYVRAASRRARPPAAPMGRR